MDAGYGGPVWHASINSRIHLPMWDLEQLVRGQLQGVGDASAGEWVERTRMVHVRRRLTDAEVMFLPPDRRELTDARGWPLDQIAERFAPIGNSMDQRFRGFAWAAALEEVGQ